MAIAIPWGDLATAYVLDRHSKHRDICQQCRCAAAIASRALNWVRPLLASAPGQVLLRQLANRTAAPPKNSCAQGDLVCGARCAMRQASDARRIWRPLMAIA